MIKVTIKESNDSINYIKIKGHANYDDYGKDIVCASVSSIVITTVNAILSFNKDNLSYSVKDGFLEIKDIKNNEITKKLLTNMSNMLLDLEKQYKKNLQVEREVN